MNRIIHIGLDVHKDSIAVAVLRPDTTEVDERVIPNTPEAIRKLLSRQDRTKPKATTNVSDRGLTGHLISTFLEMSRERNESARSPG
ncbi:MAG: transposase [Actinobacteria bacterium]|nr:transposase [Actinomycetota bacterium]